MSFVLTLAAITLLGTPVQAARNFSNTGGPSKLRPGVIAELVVGIVVLIALIVGMYYWRSRRFLRKERISTEQGISLEDTTKSEADPPRWKRLLGFGQAPGYPKLPPSTYKGPPQAMKGYYVPGNSNRKDIRIGSALVLYAARGRLTAVIIAPNVSFVVSYLNALVLGVYACTIDSTTPLNPETPLPSPTTAMSTLRPFRATDLLRFNNV